jgi:hypothetical protein
MVISIYSSPTESLAVLRLYEAFASRTVRRDCFKTLRSAVTSSYKYITSTWTVHRFTSLAGRYPGSTEVILDQQLITADQFRDRTLSEVYGTLLSRVARILRHRLAREVLTSAVTNMKNGDYLVRCKFTL